MSLELTSLEILHAIYTSQFNLLAIIEMMLNNGESGRELGDTHCAFATVNFMLVNLFVGKLNFAGYALNLCFNQLILENSVDFLNFGVLGLTARALFSILPHRFI